jgi:cell fate (sporulation/competence/biofilm development) regulator YlbF (YheA/YmcA/DUF963 family)
MIQLLKSKNLFQGDKEKLYLDKMLAHKALSDVHTAIYMLDRYGVLVEDKVELYLDVIFKSKCPFEMIHAIKMLESQHLLSGEKTKRYLDALSEHVHPLVLSGVIATFEQNASYFGDNAPACLNAILSHHNPRLMYDSIVKLNEAGLLSEADAKLYIQLVKNLSSTEDAEEGVEIESIVALLQEIKSNPDVVAKLKKSETLPSTISELHQLITREVSEHPDSSGFHAFRKEVRSLNPDSGEDADDASHNLDSPKKM